MVKRKEKEYLEINEEFLPLSSQDTSHALEGNDRATDIFLRGIPGCRGFVSFFFRTRSKGTACLKENLSMEPECGLAREIRKRAREETRDKSLR